MANIPGLKLTDSKTPLGFWQGSDQMINTDQGEILGQIRDLNKEVILIDFNSSLAFTEGGSLILGGDQTDGLPVIGYSRTIKPNDLGDPEFLSTYGVNFPYMAGAMANAISGVNLVTALGKAGYLASYGAGGVSPTKLEDAIQKIKTALPNGPYAFNLIHNPLEPHLEQAVVDLYLQHQIRTVEASAFLRLTPMVIQYRAAGLSLDDSGNIIKKNKIIAKLSRREVASQFLSPAPEKILNSLVEAGRITQQQATLAAQVPMADDITVEADSGGHTDNRPLVGLLPEIIALRNQIQGSNSNQELVRIGAAGGIGTPQAALAAFSMGAAYVVTGSINQACKEADTSEYVKQALAKADAADVMMAPSADMFEMGVKVQVLKRGTMFPLRAQTLYDTYLKYDQIEQIPASVREDIELKILQNDLNTIWAECVSFFSDRDPEMLIKAESNPKKKLALIFRWYLGLATHWGVQGNDSRKLDYQIWCGPCIGSFNAWAKDTQLEKAENRGVVQVADQIMQGAAYQYRVNELAVQGIRLE